MTGEYLETEKKTDAGIGCAGFSGKVLDIRSIYNNENNDNVYEPVAEWIGLVLEGKRQTEVRKELSMTMGGYTDHLPLDKYLFLSKCFGEDYWERGSQAIINMLCSFLSSEEVDRIVEEFSDLKYSEPTPVDEDRFEDFIERVESFV